MFARLFFPARVFASSALPGDGREQNPAHQENVSWGYWGSGAPNNWGSLSPDFSECAEGQAQSPINITGYTEGRDAPQLSFAYGGNARSVSHNGQIAHVEYDAGSAIAIGDRAYGLVAMHIHVHAEHQVDAQLFPAEIHLVHRSESGCYAVVGQLFRFGEPDQVVQSLIDAYPLPGQRRESGFTLNAADYVPADLGYYRYSGSLTTPPCTQGVEWIVLREIRTVSQEQVNRLAALHNGFNFRPIQPGNGRPIIATGPRPRQ